MTFSNLKLSNMKTQSFVVLFSLALLSASLINNAEANTSISSPYDKESVSKPIISKAEAISAVKRKLGGKVLSVNLIQSQGPAVYRVKILLDKGRVRTVFVDAANGRVVRIR